MKDVHHSFELNRCLVEAFTHADTIENCARLHLKQCRPHVCVFSPTPHAVLHMRTAHHFHVDSLRQTHSRR
jgi:hypothetical protein